MLGIAHLLQVTSAFGSHSTRFNSCNLSNSKISPSTLPLRTIRSASCHAAFQSLFNHFHISQAFLSKLPNVKTRSFRQLLQPVTSGAELSPGQSCRVNCLAPFVGPGFEVWKMEDLPTAGLINSWIDQQFFEKVIAVSFLRHSG